MQESQTLQTLTEEDVHFNPKSPQGPLGNPRCLKGGSGIPREPKGGQSGARVSTLGRRGAPKGSKKKPKVTPRRAKLVPKTPAGDQQITKPYTHKRNTRKRPIHRQTAASIYNMLALRYYVLSSGSNQALTFVVTCVSCFGVCVVFWGFVHVFGGFVQFVFPDTCVEYGRFVYGVLGLCLVFVAVPKAINLLSPIPLPSPSPPPV